MTDRPKVTVFVPAYNRERYIGATIRSVLDQTFADFELLVIDDGSTDGTIRAVEAVADGRVRLERNETNRGVPYTRNRGLELARGEYIAILDSDDCAYPERLARQVAFLDARPEIVQVGSFSSFMDEDGRPLARIRRQPVRPDDVDAQLLFRCCLSNRSIMGRTEALRAFGYREAFARCQDYDLHVRLAREHRMANLPEVLVCAREHPGRYTGQTRDLGRDAKYAIYRALLADLGVDYTEDDVAGHYLLTRKRERSSGEACDLDRAEAWLASLLEANRRVRRYAPDALARAAGGVWAGLCFHARRRLGPKTITRLLRSPLAAPAARNLDPGFLRALQTRRRPPPAAARTSQP